MPNRKIIIGDIHGCVEELTDLIDKLRVKDDDELIFVGDLLDKGPHSAHVVWYIRSLERQGVPIVLVEGNHEESHVRFRRHEKRRAGTGKKNPMSRAGEMQKINERLERDDIKFLESAVLWHRIRHLDILVVHGGVPFWMKELPPADSWRSLQPRKEREKAASMLRLRYEDDEGNFVALGSEKPRDTFWAERYDRRFGHVFFGHEPYVETKDPQQFPHATGLDTGCVYGNALTAAVFWPGVEEPEFVRVKARRKYYDRSLHAEAF